jgi:ribosome biogenesis protein Nip4
MAETIAEEAEHIHRAIIATVCTNRDPAECLEIARRALRRAHTALIDVGEFLAECEKKADGT